MLLAIQSLLIQAIKLGIRSDIQLLATRGDALGGELGIGCRLVFDYSSRWCHGSLL